MNELLKNRESDILLYLPLDKPKYLCYYIKNF